MNKNILERIRKVITKITVITLILWFAFGIPALLLGPVLKVFFFNASLATYLLVTLGVLTILGGLVLYTIPIIKLTDETWDEYHRRITRDEDLSEFVSVVSFILLIAFSSYVRASWLWLKNLNLKDIWSNILNAGIVVALWYLSEYVGRYVEKRYEEKHNIS